jgi:hypothetical protein
MQLGHVQLELMGVVVLQPIITIAQLVIVNSVHVNFFTASIALPLNA